MKRHLPAFLLALLFGCSATPDPTTLARVQGRWLSASGNVEVQIAPCGAKLCGTIVRIVANRSMSAPGQAVPARDDVGLQILTDFAPSDGETLHGRALNRENGMVYDCTMHPGGPDELVIRPYVLVSLFGQTQVWHRVP